MWEEEVTLPLVLLRDEGEEKSTWKNLSMWGNFVNTTH
jgi:hypothetical protein